MKKLFDLISEKKYFIMVILSIILIVLTLKTQVVIVKYGDNYAMRMEYTMLGKCIRASASLKATEPAVQRAVYIGGSFNETILEAVKQMRDLSGTEQTVGIMSSGYPRDNERLEQSIKEHLESNGHKVEILNVSLMDALSPKK